MRYIILLVLLMTACSITGASVSIIENGEPIEVYFCPKDNCTTILSEFMQGSVDCAFYDVEDVGVLDDRLVVDADNKYEGDAVYDTRSAYMHHKFCIGDGVLTGSMNPTYRGMNVNYNNVVIIPSDHISDLYQVEFNEMRSGKFGKQMPKHTVMTYNGNQLEVMFCPDDDCKDRAMELLEDAQKRIWFMAFSFTEPDIADILMDKHDSGVDVKGIIEGQRKTMRYNQYNRLNSAGVPVALENSSKTFHHKVFIVDDYVITGSANPTRSGYNKNDENIIIIHAPQVVEKFSKEFESLYDIMLS